MTQKQTDESSEGIRILGDSWNLVIVEVLTKKPRRFNEIQRLIGNICPVTLADRLKKLEHDRVVKRYEETVDKLSVVYELTDKGRGILPILREIKMFEKKFCGN